MSELGPIPSITLFNTRPNTGCTPDLTDYTQNLSDDTQDLTDQAQI